MKTNTQLNWGVRLGAMTAIIIGLIVTGCGPKKEGESGRARKTIANVGSDTMLQIGMAWSEALGLKKAGMYLRLLTKERLLVNGKLPRSYWPLLLSNRLLIRSY